jgi:hypothetical protein
MRYNWRQTDSGIDVERDLVIKRARPVEALAEITFTVGACTPIVLAVILQLKSRTVSRVRDYAAVGHKATDAIRGNAENKKPPSITNC